ncbi:MAG: hypothetical protein HZC12_00385 [Nitrospirae bacterium]|nr:hypothetical protein [Nitrospirota bacterium]
MHSFKKAFIFFTIIALLSGCSINSIIKTEKSREEIARITEMMDSEDFNGATKHVNKIEKAGDRDIALFCRGYILSYPKNPHRDYSKAIKTFEKLVSMFPESPMKSDAEAWIRILSVIKEQQEEISRLKAKNQELKDSIDKLKEVDKETEKKRLGTP